VATTGFEPGDRAPTAPAFFYDIASCFLTVAALFVLLPLHLLPALVAGLSVYELVQFLERALKIVRIHHRRGKLAAVGIVAFGVVLLLSLAGVGIVALLQPDNLSALLDKMAGSISKTSNVLPVTPDPILPTAFLGCFTTSAPSRRTLRPPAPGGDTAVETAPPHWYGIRRIAR